MTKLTIEILAESDPDAVHVLTRLAAMMDGGLNCHGYSVSYVTGSGVADVSHIPEHSSTQPTGQAPWEGVTP
jgi:hypothetical protein